jgi:hypothetical protein
MLKEATCGVPAPRGRLLQMYLALPCLKWHGIYSIEASEPMIAEFPFRTH